jgi:hypothetical protein
MSTPPSVLDASMERGYGGKDLINFTILIIPKKTFKNKLKKRTW